MNRERQIKDAKACAKLLCTAGYTAHVDENLGIVTLHYSDQVYYVRFPSRITYGLLITYNKLQGPLHNSITIKLGVNHIAEYEFMAHVHMVDIFDKHYSEPRYEGMYDAICDNMYYNIRGKWVFRGIFNALGVSKKVPKSYIAENFLNKDFTPFTPTPIDIANTGLKYVSDPVRVEKLSTADYTLLYTNKVGITIVPGRFSVSGRQDIFRYVDEVDGQFYALLHDDDRTSYMASNKRIITAVPINTLILEKDGDLYGGYLFDDNLTTLNDENEQRRYEARCCTHGSDEEYTDDEDEDEIEPEYMIYRFEYTFFGFHKTGHIVELNARKPNSGKLTKPAL